MSELRRLPGASYRGSNAFVIARRKLLNLEEPFRMTFDAWRRGNHLYDWYTARLSNPFIQTMQLRKERESPFFHEFIVIQLRSGTYWRIDRRQLPNEVTPLDSLYEGVPAHDTVEQVTSLESSLYARSDCLIELEFSTDVHLALVLRICRTIQNHERARVYTIQRYNCYFFAQALIFCTACGVSDWAGVGEQKGGQVERKGPWKTPNCPVDDSSNPYSLGNQDCLKAFKWSPSESFVHDWERLSKLSNTLIHASPLLRHADRCSYCINSQSAHRQRSLSSEIQRLKLGLVEYWNGLFREILAKAYMANHTRLVNSGLWGVVSNNVAQEDCEQVLKNSVDDVRTSWEKYSKEMIEKLVATVEDLLDPIEVCDAWYPEPDEWTSTWTCRDGGPVQAAMAEWQRGTRALIESEISQLEEALETQTIQAGTKAQGAAMLARINSFSQSMTINIRIAQHEGDVIAPESAAPADQKTVLSGRTKRSMRTMKTAKTVLTLRASEFKNKMSRFFSRSHKMEKGDITQMRKKIEELINLHADRVDSYKVLLKCGAEEVRNDMKVGLDEVWNRTIE
ncbi:hypothetical protein RSOLAG1IB_07752 [Rhizoctonia solani AG-1 IB]|uniref:Uncharacterized protein n=1 Tax=Thanatephorus cucumeris (strain AG1-IB / isolate 7/3/14) TaxID=1108050 RepID=A0A0B7FE95_THACB|nr:hypothetical protein RSOLAG1IB_07752 [Rhizoctonia solani AG-1 IB]